MRRVAVAVFLSAYLATLVVMAPASLLDELIQHISQGRLVMANARGTIWKGTAIPALRMRDGHLMVIHPLRWKIDVLSLPAGKIKAQLHWENLSPATAAEVLVSGGQVELSQVFIPLPARLLSEATPILKPAEFRGQLEVRSDHLVFSHGEIEGAAIADWFHAGSALSNMDPLGSYRFSLNCTGNVVSVGLSTIAGNLVLRGRGQWSQASGIEFRGLASAASGNQDRLNELLHHLGPEQSPGVFAFSLTPK